MSETIEDLPSHLYQPRREENAFHSTKEINFYKKEGGLTEELGQQPQNTRVEHFRQPPAFLNRGNMDMKRSQVVESTFDNNSSRGVIGLREFPKRPRKVSVDDFVKIK